jgi:hypothetical protein
MHKRDVTLFPRPESEPEQDVKTADVIRPAGTPYEIRQFGYGDDGARRLAEHRRRKREALVQAGYRLRRAPGYPEGVWWEQQKAQPNSRPRQRSRTSRGRRRAAIRSSHSSRGAPRRDDDPESDDEIAARPKGRF